ncbi:MAG: GNAT family N-acetyltransferase [Anaerolineae bacterium]
MTTQERTQMDLRMAVAEPIMTKGELTMRSLSADYTFRPATMADVEAATALFNACSLDLVGKEQFEAQELKSEWESPTLVLERDTRVVLTPKGQIIGYVEVWDNAPHVRLYAWSRVHPDYREQSIGEVLLEWAEGRARESIAEAPKGTRVSLLHETLVQDEVSQALLESRGFERVRYFFRMVIEMEEAPPAPRLPAEVSIRTFDRQKELPAVIKAVQEAFRDHWGFVERSEEESLKQWSHWIDNDPDFDASLWFLAEDDGQIAGMCLCHSKVVEDPEMGWVNTLGVLRPWRRQGLGLAMLHHAFGEFYRRGKRKVGLGVDASSLTGATRLYEKAGMQVQRKYANYEKILRAGEDLSTQSLEG